MNCVFNFVYKSTSSFPRYLRRFNTNRVNCTEYGILEIQRLFPEEFQLSGLLELGRICHDVIDSSVGGGDL